MSLLVYAQNAVFNVRDRNEGQTMAEYALILGGIAIIVILAIVFLGGRIRDLLVDRQLGQHAGLLVRGAFGTAVAILAPGRKRRRRRRGRQAARWSSARCGGRSMFSAIRG